MKLNVKFNTTGNSYTIGKKIVKRKAIFIDKNI
jgi:hypothetical protein